MLFRRPLRTTEFTGRQNNAGFISRHQPSAVPQRRRGGTPRGSVPCRCLFGAHLLYCRATGACGFLLVAGSAVAVACGSEAIRQEGVEANWAVGVSDLLPGARAPDEGCGATCSSQGVIACPFCGLLGRSDAKRREREGSTALECHSALPGVLLCQERQSGVYERQGSGQPFPN